MEIAVLALGCFWGPEIKFSKIDGIIKTEVGYCGGDSSKTTYKEVCTGNTNHAEVVKLDFDEKIISYEKILKIFFQIHDPTTLNSQGPDFGTQYRSEIFYLNDNQKKIAEKVVNEINEKLSGRVVTKITLLNNYCTAEEYHQKYLEKNKMSLVETDWLFNNLNKVKIIDCSWHMPQTKRNGFEEYKKSHIPGAIFFDLDKNSKKILTFHICLLTNKIGKK